MKTSADPTIGQGTDRCTGVPRWLPKEAHAAKLEASYLLRRLVDSAFFGVMIEPSNKQDDTRRKSSSQYTMSLVPCPMSHVP